MKALLLVLFLASCSFEVPAGTIRPVDEYCLLDTCSSDEFCHLGTCYAKCATDNDCETGCCWPDAERTALYCAPEEVCE